MAQIQVPESAEMARLTGRTVYCLVVQTRYVVCSEINHIVKCEDSVQKDNLTGSFGARITSANDLALSCFTTNIGKLNICSLENAIYCLF